MNDIPDIPKLPCEKCPVTIICANRYDFNGIHSSLGRLMNICPSILDWMTDADILDDGSFYIEGSEIITKYFARLKGKEVEKISDHFRSLKEIVNHERKEL